MKRIIPYLCLSGLLASSTLCAGSKRLETYLPGDTTFVASVSDMSGINGTMSKSALKAILDNKNLSDFLNPINIRIENELEDNEIEKIITREEANKYINGQALIAVDLNACMKALEQGNPFLSTDPALILLLDIKNGEALDELLMSRLNDMPDQDRTFEIQDDETFMGVTIHNVLLSRKDKGERGGESANAAPRGTQAGIEAKACANLQYGNYDDENYYDGSDETGEQEEQTPREQHLYFGVTEDTFFLSNEPESIRHIVEAIQGETKGTFGKTEEWNDLRQTSENMDAYMFVSFKTIAPALESGLRKKYPVVEGQMPNPMAPNAERIISALGLSSLHSMLISVEFKPEFAHMVANYKMDTNFGIGRLFQCVADSYPKPDFVPEAPISATSAGVNLGAFLRELRQILFNALPAASMYYQMYTAQIQEQGVNLDSDLIDNFDNGIVVFSIHKDLAEDTPQQDLIAFKIKDPDAMKRVIDAIIKVTNMQDRVQRRDYEGTELLLLPGSIPAKPAMTIAIKDGWLMLSPEIAYIQNALSTKNGSTSFWKSDRFDALDTALSGADGYTVSYTNLGAFLHAFLQTFATSYNNSTTPFDNNPDHLLNPEMASRIGEIPLFIGSKGIKTPDGFVQESFLIPTED